MKHHRVLSPTLVCWALIFIGTMQISYAGSATWNLNPTSGDWNTAANWTPETVPNMDGDVATFAISNITNLQVADGAGGSEGTTTELGEIAFQPGASSYTFTMPGHIGGVAHILALDGAGITNNSGVVQQFVTGAPQEGNGDSGRMYFVNNATAGDNTVIINQGGTLNVPDAEYGGFTQWWGTASAGNATVISYGGTVSGAQGGGPDLLFSSQAENATFINYPGLVSGAAAAYTLVQTTGTIGSSTFIGNPAAVTGAEGGWVELDGAIAAGASFIANGAATAGPQAGQIYVYGGTGYATFTGNGGQGSGAQGGLIDLFALPASDQTIVLANGGSNGGGGGQIVIEEAAVGELAQFQLFGNGYLEMGAHLGPSFSIGSIEGDGQIYLGKTTLIVGGNSLSTSFSGVLHPGNPTGGSGTGALTKIGTGTLTLSGANLYTAGTTISAGTLVVDNTTGSATGTGAMQVNAGTLGGSGIISGAVTVGTGSGAGAFLAPAHGTTTQTTLTIQSALTLNADATYTYTFKAKKKKARTDKVIANGATINSGATFAFQGTAQGTLKQGLVLTAISNTAATPIFGTFSNLPDGAILTANGNNFQASYEGGDGNDLTLMVVP